MRAPAVVLCGFCAQRSPGAPTVESIWPESRLPHSLSRRNLSCPLASNHSLKVVRQGLWPSASVFTLLLGDSNTLALTLQDILALELRNCCKYGEHKLAGRRSRVDGLLAADEFYLFLGQPFHEIKQVARVSRKSADGLDNNRVAAAACAIQRCCRK